MPTLQCEVVTPESRMYAGEADFVVLPAANGEMGIYANHEPVVTTLNPGMVRVTEHEGNDVVRYIVAGGYAQVEAERVIVLADRAVAYEKIDTSSVRVHIDDLKEKLHDMQDDDPNAAFLKSEIEWNELLVKIMTIDTKNN
ncbi:MAG: ATP synthase F1 subunit epsilon [Coriobacteriales bacterium]|jgi:F-type H+-transporting ATPase subunit epsilon